MDASSQPVRHPLLVTPSADQAEEWATVLDEAGIDVLVELTDALTGDPGGSPLVGVMAGRGPEFVHLVTIPPAQREAAVSALLDAGWNGREGLRGGRGIVSSGQTNLRGLLVGAACTAGGIVAFILIRIATG